MTRGFILQSGGADQPWFWAKLEDGAIARVKETRVKPSFYVREQDREWVAKKPCEPSDLKTFAGEPTLRVEFGRRREAQQLRESLRAQSVPTFEADLALSERWLIDRSIRACVKLEGAFENRVRYREYTDPELTPDVCDVSLRCWSVDIETALDSSEVYSIAWTSDEESEVLIRSSEPVSGATHVADERELLTLFAQRLREADPDIITGWNVIDFDLHVLQERFKAHEIPFVLGRDRSPSRLRRSSRWFSWAHLSGRPVLDGMDLVRQSAVRFDRFTLEHVAQEVVGQGKLFSGDHRGNDIEWSFHNDKAKLAAYNLEDTRLVLEILKKMGLIDLWLTRSKITGMSLEGVARSTASLDRLYLPRLRRKGFVAPSVEEGRTGGMLSGGHVLDSTPGLFEWVLVFDFKSLYPSLIRTFNIDPWAYGRAKTPKLSDSDAIIAPNGARFVREPGILPEIVSSLWGERDKAKQADNSLLSYAIKILMNSFYGVLGTSTCRFFDEKLANAITSFGQFLLKYTQSSLEDMGYDVLYGDTDSVFVLSRARSADQATSTGESIRASLDSRISDMISSRFGLPSQVELEFEKVYSRFFLPGLRRTTSGSKKRYAGLLLSEKGEEKLDVVGLEAVRRDIPMIGRLFQRKMLELTFAGESPAAYVRELVADLRAGKFDDQLIIQKGLRKDVQRYTKTTPPHVKAARKLDDPGRVIRYVVTRTGPEPVREEGEKLHPDYDYYVESILKPIADAILRFGDRTFDELVAGKRQLGLFD